MPTSRLEELIGFFIAGTISADEKRELEFLVAASTEEMIAEALSASWENYKGSKMISTERSERMLAAVFDRSKKGTRIVQLRVWRRAAKWIAAASVISAIGLGSYFLIFHKTIVPATEIAQKNDIAPPTRNRATITLANGKRVFLDSAANGALAKQGNTQIIKLADGKIAYNGKTQPKTAIEYNTLFNPGGSKVITLTLSDGTQVWLNAESSIKYPVAFSGKSRTVEITGETYFKVVHNAKMPFKVKAAAQTIEDIGTSFNVNAYGDETVIKTTLIEGSVKVSLNGSSARFLKPGEQAVTNDPEGLIIEKNIDVEQVMSWKNGWFEFGQTDLGTIMRQVGRWYDVEISYEGKPSTEKFGGRVSKNVPLSDILKSLEANSKSVKFRLEGKKLIVHP